MFCIKMTYNFLIHICVISYYLSRAGVFYQGSYLSLYKRFILITQHRLQHNTGAAQE